MSYYSVGEIIKMRRKQLGLSQAELAGLTVDVSNLSRLERGIQTMKKDKLDAILEKLGLSATVMYSDFMTVEDSTIYSKRQNLTQLLFQKKYDEAGTVIKELTAMPSFDKITDKQFVMYAKAVITAGSNSDFSTARKAIIEAIKVTISDFSIKDIGKYILTLREATLINMLAVTYNDEGDIEKAVEILYGIKTSLDTTRIENVEKADIFPLILYNLTKFLGILKRFDEALELCDYAIKFCTRYNNMRLLPQIIVNKACGVCEIGDKEMGKRLFHQAYYCCEAFGYFEERDMIKKQAKAEFGLLIR